MYNLTLKYALKHLDQISNIWCQIDISSRCCIRIAYCLTHGFSGGLMRGGPHTHTHTHSMLWRL